MRLLSNSIDFSEWDSMKIRPCIVFPSMIVLINTVCHMSCILHEFGDPSRYFLFFLPVAYEEHDSSAYRLRRKSCQPT